MKGSTPMSANLSSMANLERIAILGGARIPFARANSVYKKYSAAALGGIAIREAVARTGIDPKVIGETYLGIVSFPAEGTNVAREAVFDSGLPPTIPCTTVNRYCASSLEAAYVIAAKLQARDIDVGVAAGAESISSMRALFSSEATDFFQGLGKAKSPAQAASKFLKFKLKYLAPNAPGINEPTTGLSMGQSADLMTRLFQISREEQDRFALDSHLKAHQGWENGFFKSHVCAVSTPDGKIVDRDTDVRADSSLEKLSKLKPVFYKDGTITAGNASPLTDGASAIVLTREEHAKTLGVKPLGYIRSIAAAAIDIQKEPLLIGPVYAFPAVLQKAGLTFKDIELFEIHEAFAGQVLSTLRALESKKFAEEKLGLSAPIGTVDPARLNLYGGSVSIGHPFGATGGRMILQTLHALKAQKKRFGLISICAAGGLGMVAVIEAL